MPAGSAQSEKELCSRGVALRLAAPLDGARTETLKAFVAAVAARAKLAPERLKAKIDERLAKRGKYEPIAADGPVSVEAGFVPHPTRGDVFIVSFGWPSR